MKSRRLFEIVAMTGSQMHLSLGLVTSHTYEGRNLFADLTSHDTSKSMAAI